MTSKVVTGNGCLEVRVEHRDGLVVISPVGEVDLLTMPVLAEALAEVIVEKDPSVVLDLSRTDFLACCAVKVVVAAEAALSASGGSLRWTGARRSVRRLLALCEARGLLTRPAAPAATGQPGTVGDQDDPEPGGPPGPGRSTCAQAGPIGRPARTSVG